MLRRNRCLAILALTASLAASIAPAQEPTPAADAPEAASRVDFKVVSWFDRARPIASFQYQVYDIRKGDYTPAVDAWVAMMREKYPNYDVRVSPVDLTREAGPTEKRKVGAVVHRELLAAAAAEGVFLGGASNVREMIRRQPLTVRIEPLPGFGGPYVPSPAQMAAPGLAPAGFPVPIPFPRPHP